MASTIDLLNQVLALHSASLPSYVMYAKPFVGSNDSKAMNLFRQIGEDHFRTVNIVGHVILRQGGKIVACDFPMIYTDMHDLSVDYVFHQIEQQNATTIIRLNQIVAQLQNSPEALAVTLEALGAAKAHSEQLSELALQYSA